MAKLYFETYLNFLRQNSKIFLNISFKKGIKKLNFRAKNLDFHPKFINIKKNFFDQFLGENSTIFDFLGHFKFNFFLSNWTQKVDFIDKTFWDTLYYLKTLEKRQRLDQISMTFMDGVVHKSWRQWFSPNANL